MKVAKILFHLIFSFSFLLFSEPLRAEVKQIKLEFDGLSRNITYNLPKNIDEKIPLVILLHGGTQTAERVWEQTKLPELSEKEGFILAAPNAYGKVWNDGRKVYRGTNKLPLANDVKFLSFLIDFFIDKYSVDKNKIYLIGASNGGMMSMKMACEAPEKITAVASFIASLTKVSTSKCDKDFTMPILLVNANEDKFIPWEGGSIDYFGKKLEPIISAENLAKFWRDKNNCDDKIITKHLEDKNTKDGSYVIYETSKNCKNGSEVVFFKVAGAGHTWPNIDANNRFLLRKFFGNTNKDIDSAQVAWDFFKGK